MPSKKDWPGIPMDSEVGVSLSSHEKKVKRWRHSMVLGKWFNISIKASCRFLYEMELAVVDTEVTVNCDTANSNKQGVYASEW